MSITDMDFEDVQAPRGAFIGWGEIGQTVTGAVISYSDDGGIDFHDNICPQVVLELTEPAVTFKDKGATRETIDGGEFATITCGLASLKKNIKAASLEAGDIVRIKYEENYKTAKGDGKGFKVQVARGAARKASATSATASTSGDVL